MASDWQIGDLAVCIAHGEHTCREPGRFYVVHEGLYLPPVGLALPIRAIKTTLIDRAGKPTKCGCVGLVFDGGLQGIAKRFRKVRPDAHEACEEEFVTLLKRKNSKVLA